MGVTLIANVSSADSFPLPESAATLPFVEDWECGLLRPCWSVTGAWPGRVIITSTGGPYNSRSHLTLDSAQAGTAARNEVTLKVNLAGASNVVLRFRARGYNNLNPPPAPSRPFLDGADFNGVAVSSEGRHWWEVCSLRSLDYDCQARVPRSLHGDPVNPENDMGDGPITSNVSSQKHLIAVNGTYSKTILFSLVGQTQYINTHALHVDTFNGGRGNWLYLRHMIQKSR